MVPQDRHTVGMADGEKLEVVLKADGSTRGLNLYISSDQRDELVRQLQLVELPVRYVVQESAAQILEHYSKPHVIEKKNSPRVAS